LFTLVKFIEIDFDAIIVRFKDILSTFFRSIDVHRSGRRSSLKMGTRSEQSEKESEGETHLFDRNVVESAFRQGEINLLHLASSVDRETLGR